MILLSNHIHIGSMKLLKDFIDTTNIIKDLKSVNIVQPQSNAGINQIDFSQRESKHKGWVFLLE